MLLLDQHISYRLLRLLETDFPGCMHVSRCGLVAPAKDHEIWEFALKHRLVILTFDEDFSDLLSVRGSPPKVVWFRTGNLPTRQLADKLLTVGSSIHALISDPQWDLLEVY